MSSLRDSISDRSVDLSRPSTSHTPASPQRSKSSHNNKFVQKKVSSKSPKHMTTPRQKREEIKIVSQSFINSQSSMAEAGSMCDNMIVNSGSDDDSPLEANPTNSKRKNARKKERLKKLVMPQPQSLHGSEAPVGKAQTDTRHTAVNTSVHDLFKNQIGPLYANSSSRYLENLAYHPHYQLQAIQEMLKNSHLSAAVSSAPNTPLVNAPASASTSSASVLKSPTSPGYLHNALQHPLLSKSFSMESHENFKRMQPTNRHMLYQSNMKSLRQTKSSPKKGKQRDKKDHDHTFEPYLSIAEVQKGLENNTLFEGVLRINPKQFQHGYVSNSDRNEQDILIDGIKNRNRSLEGDIIVVQLIQDEAKNGESNSEVTKQKKGKVVYIKEKVHTRTCIGNLKLMADKNRQRALFVPRDHRVPRLNIPFTCWPNNFYDDARNFENTLFSAKIVEWSDVRFAIGTILCNIGQSGDMVTEMKAILAQTDLDVSKFPPEVRDLYPRLDYVIPEDEIEKREDCRKLCLFSIDPISCRDIDDAVSCRKLKNGNYEIGVHISDVSHFLTEDTLLDEKVSEKATTIYLVEKAFHMLPDDLCMLCSLFPGIDKLAFSVFWEITENAEILSHRFAKTVIHSCGQLAYEHAQAVLDGDPNAKEKFPEIYNGWTFHDVEKTIKTLGNISAIFRQKRFGDGALRIDQPKVSFHLSATNGLPDSFWIYESKASHQLIEEFMLLANITVAHRIYDDHPRLAFLRCHPPPSGFMMKQLAASLKPMGIDLEISSAGDVHKSLAQYVGPDCDPGKAMVLSMLCAKPMARAKYFCADGCDDDDFSHYALNVPLYTHFTSPIRRYADIMVHRLLSASLNYREVPKWETDKVRMIAAQCNKQKYNAKKAGELSTELYTLKYIEMNSPMITDAVVVDVREKYIDVIIVAMGLNRRIFFNNDFPGEFNWVKSDVGMRLAKMELKWKATKTQPAVEQVIEVFSILKVELHKEDELVKVETKLCRPD